MIVRILTALFLLSLPIDKLGIDISGSNLRIGVLLLLILALIAGTKLSVSAPITRSQWTIVAILGLAIVVSFFGSNFEFRTIYYSAYFFTLIVLFVFVVPCLPNNTLVRWFDLTHNMHAWITIFIAIGLVSGLQLEGFADFNRGYYRVGGFTYEPSYLGTFLGTYAVYYAFLLGKRMNGYTFSGWALIIAAVAVTQSVAGSVLLVFALSTFLVVSNKFKASNRSMSDERGVILRLMFTSIGAVLVFLAIGMPYLLERVSVAGSIADLGGERVYMYAILAEAIQESPWIGSGIGTIVPDENFWFSNVILEILIDGGAVLLFALILAFWWAIRHGLHGSMRSKALAISLIAHLLVLQANQNFMRLYTWIYVSLIFATTISKNPRNIRPSSEAAILFDGRLERKLRFP